MTALVQGPVASLQAKLEQHLGAGLTPSQFEAFRALAQKADFSGLIAENRGSVVSFGNSSKTTDSLSFELLSKAVKDGGAEIEAAKQANGGDPQWYFQWTYNFDAAQNTPSAQPNMK